METVELFNVLPILYNAWTQQSLYPFLTILCDCCISITHNQDAEERYLTFKWLEETKPVIKNWVTTQGIDRRTARSFLNYKTDRIEEDNFTCLLPISVWLELTEAFNRNAATIGRRKSITRVFMYLYYYAMRFQGSFSHSREQMLVELHINNHTLNDSLDWLEENEFIVRSDYSMRPDERYARRYYIPEKYWNAACKKEWINLQNSLTKD